MHTISKSKSILLAISVFLIGVFSYSSAFAHGGASGVDLDQCRIPVAGHWVHFTAYQPQVTGTAEYCESIPELGQTILVFDYEDKALRDRTVEFEITKEPEGKRVFYQPPAGVPTGSFNTQVNFTEGGKYLAHVTLVSEGQKVDAHVPFAVGAKGMGPSLNTIIVGIVVLLALGYIFYLSNAAFKQKVDRMITRGKEL
jgi:hypothetical protein